MNERYSGTLFLKCKIVDFPLNKFEHLTPLVSGDFNNDNNNKKSK